MKWASAISSEEHRRYGSARQYVEDCVEQIYFQLSGEAPDLAIVFVSPHFVDEYEHIPELVKSKLQPKHLIGCSAGGLIGGGIEIERQRAIAITAARLPNVEISTLHLKGTDLPDLDDGPSSWERLMQVSPSADPHFILLPDPFSFPIDTLAQGLDFAFPDAAKFGGLASGANQPQMNALFMNDELYREGAVVAIIAGNVVVESIVSQGCRPIGRAYTITECEDNLLIKLDGKSAVNALREVLETLTDKEQSLAKNSLFIGLAMDEFKEDHKTGDFLVRNILGIEPKTGALLIGELLRTAQTVQFHIRDAATSAEDLDLLLKQYTVRATPDTAKAEGALLFSCLGRGKYLYGESNHDSECFRQHIGEVPLGGFFCNGEIGQIGKTTFLHGYTSSFAIFKPKTPALG